MVGRERAPIKRRRFNKIAGRRRRIAPEPTLKTS